MSPCSRIFGRSFCRIDCEPVPCNLKKHGLVCIYNKHRNYTACADFPNIVAEHRFYAQNVSDAMFRRTASLCLRFASTLGKNATSSGVVHSGGGYDPQIWTRARFLCNAPTPKFHHPMLTHSEVIVFTNKQTHKPTNRCRRKHPTFFAMLRRWVNITSYFLQYSAGIIVYVRRTQSAMFWWYVQTDW